MTTARQTYEVLAPDYDRMTQSNDYNLWLGETLLPKLERHGLQHGRALDAGCGTGRAFAPLLDRGWEVTGCDISPAMLDEARRKFPDVHVSTADLCELPEFGMFDLVLALNDVVNYLTDDGDLERGLAGLAANLAPGGLLLFDSNTLNLFQRLLCAPEIAIEGTYDEVVEIPGVEPHVHRQRHFSTGQIRAAVENVHLDLLALLGQREKDGLIVLSNDVDETRDEKIVCIAGTGLEKVG
jgi:SAM-dependent methyltransferase